MPIKTFCRYIVTDIEGEPWFRASDLGKILGYENTRQAILAHVDEADRISGHFDRKIGRPSTYVNEVGMYALIFGSKKPEAKRFKQWVTSKVLPEICKIGRYCGSCALLVNARWWPSRSREDGSFLH
jgi:prophage antirepressor-like protein